MKQIFAVIAMSILLATSAFGAEKAKILSKQELKTLIEKAGTPAEHNRLAQHYRLQSEKFAAMADEHADMAKMYRAWPTVSESKHPMSPDTAAHCDYFVESLRKASTEALALSAAHADMAKK